MAASELRVGDLFQVKQGNGIWTVLEDCGSRLKVQGESGRVLYMRKNVTIFAKA